MFEELPDAQDRGERYPRVTEADLDEAGRALYETILGGPRGSVPGQFPIRAADGTLNGPFGTFLFSPLLGDPLQEIGARLRSASVLGPRLRELATIASAAEAECEFELTVHRPLAIRAGIDPTVLDEVIAGGVPVEEREGALVRFARANVRTPVPEAEFEALVRVFDRQEVFELIVLVGYYRTLASLLDLFRIQTPRIEGMPT